MSFDVFDRLPLPPASVSPVRSILIDAATGTSMTHAWLFTGQPGSGRSTTAVALAAALCCTTPHGYGCGECRGCRAVLANNHPDVLHVVPQELSLGVDFVRNTLVRACMSAPTIAPWRIVIIEDADRLTDEAANALLKTVEEPPERTCIMLCAPSIDPTDFPVTLRSRCRHVAIPTPSPSEIARIVREDDPSISEPIALLAAAASAGHIGRARHLAHSRTTQERRAMTLNLAGLIVQTENDASAAYRAASALMKSVEAENRDALESQEALEKEALNTSLGIGAKGKGASAALRGSRGEINDLEKRHKRRRTRSVRDGIDLALIDCMGLYRDALMMSAVMSDHGGAASEVQGLIHPDFSKLSQYLAQEFSIETLVKCVDAITWARELLTRNVKPMLALDGMIGAMRSVMMADRDGARR